MNRNLIVHLTNGDQDNIFPSAYYDHKGKVIHDGLVSSTDRSKWDGYEAQIEAHTSNSGIHVTTNNKTKWNNHVNDATATLPVYHLTSDEKDLLKNLYQKVYPVGCVYSSINNVLFFLSAC